MKIILISELTIDDIKESLKNHDAILVHNPFGNLFQHAGSLDGIPKDCLLVDVQSLNAISMIYDYLKTENQAKFNTILQDEYKFARFLDSMWEMVN